MGEHVESINWVILTRGDRSAELGAAIQSVRGAPVTVVWNGVEPHHVPGTQQVVLTSNLGVPGGRARGASSTTSDLIGFLDDDARLLDDAQEAALAPFADPAVAAVCCRLVDEHGDTSRRHIPRAGRRGADAGGPVATFLGGASVIRRSAYDAVGGYWADLFYGHEELDLAWRLIDAGWRVEYVPSARVFHPRTDISRHADGWRLTGRNRVMIARRNLPWPVAIVHCVVWLALGLLRAPDSRTRKSYLAGWRNGWTRSVPRQPVAWRTVWRLTTLGRPPFV